MSRTKAVHVLDRLVWVLDNSHDVVLARMVEAAQAVGGIDQATVDDWRVWASIPDLALDWKGYVPDTIFDVLDFAQAAIERTGDIRGSDLVEWSVLDGNDVSGGFLRYDVLPVEALLDTLQGFRDLFSGDLAPDPPEGWWFLGVPGGRRTIGRRAGI